MNEIFRGTGVALVTPFTSDRAVDFPALGKIIDHVIEGGVNYVVSLGTTGETATLTLEEQNAVLDFTIEHVANRVPIVAGYGGNNTTQVVEQISKRSFNGIAGILSASPYYNKPSQEGIFQHYAKINEVAPVPIIAYNVPGRTSSNITADTTLRLANELDKVVAIKEASGDLIQCMEIVNRRPKGFLVISGEDLLTSSMLSFEMDGVISVNANAFPYHVSTMVKAGLAHDSYVAKKKHFHLFEVTKLLFKEGNPAGVKAALSILGLCENVLRLPLVGVSETTYKAIEEQIDWLENLDDLV